MILTLGVFVVSGLGGLLAWGRLGSSLHRDSWMKSNYRGQQLVAVSGLLSVLVALAGTVSLIVNFEESLRAKHGMSVLLLLATFCVLGFFDDVSPQESGGGFVGHLKALLRERKVTSGLFKLLGGLGISAIAIVVADVTSTWVQLIRAVLIVACSANLLNLFDRAPGRATKVSIVWWVVLVGSVALWASPSALVSTVWASAMVGATVGLMPSELLERHMQGDSGVNALGAIIGFNTVLVASDQIEWLLLVALLGLNLLSERVSFSSLIARNQVLRRLDNMGSSFPR
ncbi:MAG: UDP-GlcNAc:undecaprenyl-phosphate GlcNAc-1-phosphate transferase [Candidatus Poriferisodalaceae bacterium]